jgi:hypothetical protein
VEKVSRVGVRLPCPGYDALLRENERMRDSLVEAHEENYCLWQLYRGRPPWTGSERRSAAYPRGARR